MAKLIGPLMSFGATGQIGKAMVTGSWRGVSYARQYVTPGNPRTVAQQTNRARFATLNEMWKLAPAPVKEAFDAFAQGRRFLGVNAFLGQNNKNLQGQTDWSLGVMSPSARGGLPPLAVNASTGGTSGEIDVDLIAPDALPSGWVISRAVAVAFPEFDPSTPFLGPFVSGTDASAPYAITLSGLPVATACAVFAWFEYTRPDGRTAYSVSLYSTATSGA